MKAYYGSTRVSVSLGAILGLDMTITLILIAPVLLLPLSHKNPVQYMQKKPTSVSTYSATKTAGCM